MNIIIETCPQGHGVLIRPDELDRHVSGPTRATIRGLIEAGRRSVRPCPTSDGPLHSFVLDGVPAEGCDVCTNLWFDNASLRQHVIEVRSHTYGLGGFPLRPEVEQGLAGFYPAEIIAGLLADFELELNDEGISTHALKSNA